MPGKPVFGFLLDVPSAELVEILGLLGFDTFTIEGEHGVYDDAFYLSLIRAAELHGMAPQIRINTIHPDQICRLLDLGLQGIHYTHVSSAEDARSLVKAAKYYPEGERGFGRFSRANLFGLTDEREAVQMGNDAIYLSVAIEDMSGVDHLEEICGVPGIDHVGVRAIGSGRVHGPSRGLRRPRGRARPPLLPRDHPEDWQGCRRSVPPPVLHTSRGPADLHWFRNRAGQGSPGVSLVRSGDAGASRL